MNSDKSFPQVTLSFSITPRERTALLRVLDSADEEALALINHAPPQQPLILSAKELHYLASVLAVRCYHQSSPAPLLVKLLDRMDHMIGTACGLRPRLPVATSGGKIALNGRRIQNILIDGTEDHSGHQLIAEMQAVLRARLKGPVELIPDFKLSAAAKRTMRRSPRPPA